MGKVLGALLTLFFVFRVFGTDSGGGERDELRV